MSVNIACPECQSDNVQRVAMAHAQNTSVVYDHRNRAAGVQQTAMGIALSPPKPRKMWWRWLITGYFGIDTIAAIPMSIAHPPAVIGLVVVLVLSLLGYKFLVAPAKKYNDTVYADEKAHWDRAWLCSRCGSVFEL